MSFVHCENRGCNRLFDSDGFHFFCSAECRAEGHARLLRTPCSGQPLTPYSIPAVQQTRRRPAPQRSTFLVRDAEGALSALRDPAETRRLNAAQEDDMLRRLTLGRSQRRDLTAR